VFWVFILAILFVGWAVLLMRYEQVRLRVPGVQTQQNVCFFKSMPVCMAFI